MLTLRVPTVHISRAAVVRRLRCCRDVLQLTYELTALPAAVEGQMFVTAVTRPPIPDIHS